MSRTSGRLLWLIALGHALVGIALFRAPLAAMFRDGLVNSIDPRVLGDAAEAYGGRSTAFWFLLFSPALFMLGQIANRAVARGDAGVLRIIGWHLLALGVVGVIIMPVSGFWTLIAVSPFLLNAARRAQLAE